jgi:hypothetical protein
VVLFPDLEPPALQSPFGIAGSSLVYLAFIARPRLALVGAGRFAPLFGTDVCSPQSLGANVAGVLFAHWERTVWPKKALRVRVAVAFHRSALTCVRGFESPTVPRNVASGAVTASVASISSPFGRMARHPCTPLRKNCAPRPEIDAEAF